MKIVFVCSGNTCRSPMAEYLFRDIVKKLNLSNIEVTSAGIFTYEGREPSYLSVKVMIERGIDISSHRSRKLTFDLIKEASLIYTMTKDQLFVLGEMYPEFKNKILTLGEEDIEDPFGLDIEKYREVRDKIEKAITKIVENLKERVVR
ncbi:low molecular weight protein arginine phosphatase [Dictyoglomus thermophilum]|uniref:protein-tyrosine-phosphatase n=2 Tax=Dictyoglomus thermophilum TaxID=14 RepID=B5YDB5_DICT6|nr:low molecular weight protein arginine phosphatase [Dictyoglomus thermophilum]ACI18877.1 protein tyrosine phosphatase [Dictyoglomus thermophilum H-6-12]MCX7721349.1 low molecular weight protein arginine phosphatase [Dictyoglomus thermophilum]TYT22937.1 low molecular weight protein arginine phosphatase [Dictyoglomus thermophilum]